MTESSGADENLQRWAATDYRLAGSGVESDCKKERCFLFQVILFNYFLGIFFALLPSPLARKTKLTAGPCRTKIQIVRADVSAVAKTLVFTVFVPGTVAGYVPWRLRQDAAPVTGAEEWAAITVIVIGIAIYLHTAFWGFALIGGGTPAPNRSDQNPRRQRFAPLRAQPDVHRSRARHRRTSLVVPLAAHRDLHGLHAADCPPVRHLLRGTDAAQAVWGRI